jgi:hypothetical protein
MGYIHANILNCNKTRKSTELSFKNGSKTEKAGLHLYTKYHEALMLRKKISIDPLMSKI